MAELHPENLKPFPKGVSGNPKGRPKSFKQLRALVVSVSGEPIKDGDNKTLIENRIRKMLKSDNPADIALVLKYGWGNVPDEIDVTSKGKSIKSTDPAEIASRVAALMQLAEKRKDDKSG